MIVPHIENPVMINIGRPVIFDEPGYNFWFNVHKFIKESNVRVMVNSAFAWIDTSLNDKEFRYSGGGMQYCFWFENQTAADLLLEYMKKEA